MEVRIRHARSAKSSVLADIPFRADVIDKVIPTLQSWGVNTEYGTSGDMLGQFVVDEDESYFEVVIGSDD